ncbi:hypothetical protein KXZ74_26015, partial [Escherichia coli]|nr:hypothetical protein [Escherichia coli]
VHVLFIRQGQSARQPQLFPRKCLAVPELSEVVETFVCPRIVHSSGAKCSAAAAISPKVPGGTGTERGGG